MRAARYRGLWRARSSSEDEDSLGEGEGGFVCLRPMMMMLEGEGDGVAGCVGVIGEEAGGGGLFLLC